MSYAIVASSRTGNTRAVAVALERAFGDQVVYFGGLPGDFGDLEGVDDVLAGFWTDKGSCDPEMAAFLGRLHGKRVFLFGTAGFGGSDEYFEQVVRRVAENLPDDAELAGWAMCQGKMGPAVRDRLERALAENPGDARSAAMLENYNRALSHPDEADMARVVDRAKEALAR